MIRSVIGLFASVPYTAMPNPLAPCPGPSRPSKVLLDVMDVVFQQLDVRPGSHNVYAKRCEPMFRGTEVANFKTLNPHVALVVNRDNALSVNGSEMVCIQDCCLAWIASESDVSVTRIAGCVDAHKLFVDSASYVDRTASTRGVRGMLNRAPGRSLGAGIRILPRCGDIEGGVDLAERSADTPQEDQEKRAFPNDTPPA